MTQEIHSFRGEYFFLSNFYDHPVTLGEWEFPTSEHAYQAAKSVIPEDWRLIQSQPFPGKAKRMGRQITMRPDWDEIKLTVMETIIAIKFSDPHLRELLLATKSSKLIERNNWGDTFWGVCNGVGKNHLGRILMAERTKIKQLIKEPQS